MELYSYSRSTTSYRVRIALNIKQLDYSIKPVSLLEREQHTESYNRINPQGLVPALITDDGHALTQSLAICEYLDETYPSPPLLPKNSEGRAYVRSLANVIACDIHPLNNLRVLNYLTGELGVDDNQRATWYQLWVAKGFRALETMLSSSIHTGLCCYGDTPTLADIALVAQWYNANRFNCPLQDYALLAKTVSYCESLEAFAKAHPDHQPDAI
ncbi:MAG: maleylacetoacetate isomerase [Pseudomonadales bacterium]|nr:maleylacetoacetate isomerase [Pseudomonadales bacterium]